MKKPFEIEFYYKGDVIDTKEYDVLPHIPSIDEIIYLQCENPNMNDIGFYFKVIEIRSLFFNVPILKQKVLIKLKLSEETDW